MADKKQLLILEDLGIPKADFAGHTMNADLPYEIVWEEDSADPEKVEALVTVKKQIDAKLLKKFPNVSFIGVAFTGYDSVDLKACKEKEIAVYNVPAYSTDSVTELTIGLSIAMLREIPRAQNQLLNGKWDTAPGIELAGKTIGIFGTGKIGITVAKVFKALNCKLIAWSRSEQSEFTDLGGCYISDKNEFFSRADIISVHVPLNENTQGIIGKEELDQMKESAYIINTARGPIIDETALIETLKTKRIAGAALDVYAQEPVDPDNELLQLDNVILTPHIAFKTREALQRRAEVTVKNAVAFLSGSDKNRVG